MGRVDEPSEVHHSGVGNDKMESDYASARNRSRGIARGTRRPDGVAAIHTICRVRIPRKLDGRSMANWTPVPRQSGQSERSDAGVESVYSWMGSSVNVG